METVNLRKLKRPELIKLAGHFKIKRRHRLRKRELIKRLEKLLPRAPEKPSLSLLPPRESESTSRFAPPAAQQPHYVDYGPPIPLHYGEDRITALVRDPNCLYIYWELEGPRRAQVIREHGDEVWRDASWVLRLHTDGDGSPQDIPIVVEGCNWYLSVAEGRSFTVEIGIMRPGGAFISFARSNRAQTPRMGVSPDTSREWMLVEDDFRRVVRLGAEGAPRVSGGFADTLGERFRTPDMGSRFLGGSERVAGSPNIRRRTTHSRGK